MISEKPEKCGPEKNKKKTVFPFLFDTKVMQDSQKSILKLHVGAYGGFAKEGWLNIDFDALSRGKSTNKQQVSPQLAVDLRDYSCLGMSKTESL